MTDSWSRNRFVEDRTFKLLVIDSVMNLFRGSRLLSRIDLYLRSNVRTIIGSDFSGRGGSPGLLDGRLSVD
jgi:hypothetical protein